MHSHNARTLLLGILLIVLYAECVRILPLKKLFIFENQFKIHVSKITFSDLLFSYTFIKNCSIFSIATVVFGQIVLGYCFYLFVFACHFGFGAFISSVLILKLILRAEFLY